MSNELYLYSEPISSVSTVIGNITASVKDHILARFPSNFFKHIQMATNIPSISDRFMSNTDMKNFRKLNPALSILPEWQPDPWFKEDFVSASNYIRTPGSTLVNDPVSLTTLFEDHDDIKIDFELDRIRIEFQIGIRVDSRLKVWDITNHLNTVFRPNQQYFLNEQLVAPRIPNSFIEHAANKHGFTSLTETVDYFKQYSLFPIEMYEDPIRKGKSVVFNYPTNFRLVIGNPPSYSVNKRGKVESNSVVNFSLVAFVTYPNNFIMKTVKLEDKEMPNIDDIVEDDGARITVVLPLPEAPPAQIENKKLSLMQGFVTEINTVVEHIELGQILDLKKNKTLRTLVNFYKSNGEDPESFIDSYVYVANKRLPDDFYIMDWETETLILNAPLANSTYHVAMYLDHSEFYKCFQLTDPDFINLTNSTEKINE